MYKTRPGVLDFLLGWIQALRWQRLREMDRLGEFFFRHIEGHRRVLRSPRAVRRRRIVNMTIKAVLKLKWATAHPIRSARDLARFLNPQGLYSNR